MAVLTEPHEAIALVNTIYKEMQQRYNLYKRNRRALSTKEPFMIVFDEYTEFQEAIKTFYANTKEKGAPPGLPDAATVLLTTAPGPHQPLPLRGRPAARRRRLPQR